jgi:hypothetical protein
MPTIKTSREVKYVIPAVDVNMGGIILKQALPTQRINQIDPFLLLHHASFDYRDDSPAIHQGIGPHPHRGFSPVTFIIEGDVHHRDSRGNNQIAKKGEVQWMHTGAGIVHSERPSQELADQNGTQEIIQLWINSPANKKMQPPNYQYIPENDIPIFWSEDKAIQNKVIAGNYENEEGNSLKGKIKTESELLILWSKAEKEGSQMLSIPKEMNAMIYLVKGEMRIKGYGKANEKELIVFETDTVENIEINIDTNVEFLVLCGVPINEKITQHGPFVMNTQTEIMEAMRDYQMGKMGVLIEEK